MKPVTVILPTFNERGNIERLIAEIVRRLSGEFEIVVADDDSPDRTWEAVEKMSERDPRIRLIRRLSDHGLTNSLREGIAAARYDRVIWMDADFAHPPALLPALAAVPDEVDIALASRYVPGGHDGRTSAPRRLVSVLLNRLSRRALGSAVHDLSSGYLRVKKEVFDTVPLRGEYGDYCIDFLARAEKRGYRIVEVPYTNLEREKGYSKTTRNPLIFFRLALIYGLSLIKLRYEIRGGRP
jgi:dolichol-phosphate mannosyltransferase